MEKRSISQLHAESFLVCDETFKDSNSAFVKWLESEGFTYAWYKGNYGVCDWAYINITSKQYAYGMPGVQITDPTGSETYSNNLFTRNYTAFPGEHRRAGQIMHRTGIRSGL